jgi:hypothetical protein
VNLTAEPAGEQWRAGIGRDSRLASAEGYDFDAMVTGDWLTEDQRGTLSEQPILERRRALCVGGTR